MNTFTIVRKKNTNQSQNTEIRLRWRTGGHIQHSAIEPDEEKLSEYNTRQHSSYKLI